MSIVDTALLQSVTRPVAAANGLPNGFYTDPETFEMECERVFRKNWSLIGFGKDVPEPGDARPVDFLGMPLLLLRTRDNVLRVFQNVCRHRGMILVKEAGSLKGVIRCPYHSWCYSHDGALVTTPHVGGPGRNSDEAIKREELGLIEVRSHVFLDGIYVNVSGDAEPFETYAGGVLDRWAEFADRPLYHGGPDSSFRLELDTNWKLAVENYCESYHLPWVHPGLNSYSRLEDHYNIVARRAHSGQGTVVYNPSPDESGRAFPLFEGLSDKWDTGAEYIALYPNVLLGVHKDHVFSILLEPRGHDRTVEHVEIYYARPEAAGPDFADLRARNTAMWKEVFMEDVGVVEGMHKGRSAPGFDGGRFAPAMDEPTHCFHDWVAHQFGTGS